MHFPLLGGTSHFGCLFPLNYIGTRECMGWNEMGLEQCMITTEEKLFFFLGGESLLTCTLICTN